MAYNPIGLARLEWKVQSAFGTAEGSGFTALEAEAFIPPVSREVHENPATRAGFYALAPLSGRQSKLEVTIRIPFVHGVSAATPTDNPTANFESEVLRAILGYSHNTGYAASAQSTSSTTSSVKIKTATSSGIYDAGAGVIFTDGTSYEIGYVQQTTDGGGSDHTVALLQALSLTPAEDGTTYGCITNAMKSVETAVDPIYFTIRQQMLDSNTLCTMEGCCPKSIKFTADPGGVLSAEVTFAVNSVDFASGTLSDTSYTLRKIPVLTGANAAKCWIGGSLAGVQSLALTVSQELTELGDWNGLQGIAGWRASKRMAELEFTRLAVSAEPKLDLTASPGAIVLQAGSAPGNMWGLCIPANVDTSVGELVDSNGLLAQTFLYKPGRYVGDDGSTFPADSCLRVVWG